MRFWFAFLCLGPLLVLSGPLERAVLSFENSCKAKNNNLLCDMECRGFRKYFEAQDCSETEMDAQEVDITLETDFLGFPGALNMSRMNRKEELNIFVSTWADKMEFLLRNTTLGQFQLRIGQTEFEEIGIHCLRSLPADSCSVDLSFFVYVRRCSSCPTIDEVLDHIRNPKVFSHLGIRNTVVHSSSEGKTNAVPIAIIAIFVVVGILFVIGVLQKYTTSRKRKFVNAPVWIPPFETKKHKLSDTPATSVTTFDEYDFPPYQFNSGHSTTSAIPPPPKRMPPPVYEHKNKYVAHDCKTQLHELVLSCFTSAYTEEYDQKMADTAERILRQENIDIDAFHYGETAFMMAVRNEYRHLAARLLQFGANGNLKSNLSALHHAVVNGDVLMLSTLLSFPQMVSEEVDGRPAIDALDGSCKTPLMRCAEANFGTCSMAMKLIEAGAKIDDQGEQTHTRYTGKTALHFAAEQGYEMMVMLLLQKAEEQEKNFIDIQALEGNGLDTALYRACFYGKTRIVQILMEAGANQFIGDAGNLPMDAAGRSGFQEIVTILNEFRGKGKSNPANQMNGNTGRKTVSAKRSRSDSSRSPPSIPSLQNENLPSTGSNSPEVSQESFFATPYPSVYNNFCPPTIPSHGLFV